jgi:Rad3-related DNA helicase
MRRPWPLYSSLEELNMTQAIVGVFDSFDEANRAVERLERAGIARTDIQVHGKDSSAATYDTTAAGDRRPEGEGVLASIELP